ncbi:MAG: exonuclease SbcCD subunit D C-terminal domain-containing protein [Methanosarcinales archaeon]|nr:exonuclease SbcCD subunit D C-terminal domain-containing protein [Methanosarcinales archaeon]
MRILHTSDWHIGKKIYGEDRLDEYARFLDWLLETIIDRNVDVLLVSGDVFDSSMPPARATDLYYRFLFNLYGQTRTHAVIIAGNHDSAVRLAAPGQFLKMARMHVVGDIRDSAKDCVIHLDVNGQTAAFAAVPYLNEGDILPHIPLEAEIERSLRYREAMKRIYDECLSAMDADIKVFMGHYFIQGGTPEDSERLVQIGGIEPVRTDDLPGDVDYIALGHLHKPQQIKGNGCPVMYPGSPLPLSFKEAGYDKKYNKKYNKQVLLVDLGTDVACNIEKVTVPVFRDLVKVEGTLNDLEQQANFGDWKDKYIEVKVFLEGAAVGVGDKVRQAFAQKGGKVLVVESVLPTSGGEILSTEDIKTRTPVEIFQDFYKYKFGESGSDIELDELLTTFNELLDIAKEQEVEL